jgi:hypothetical protein
MMVNDRKVKVTRSTIDVKIDNPRALLKEIKKAPLEDLACFTDTLTRLETDIDAMRVRANAWARGDIAGIRKLDFVDHQESCANVMRNNAALRDHPAFRAGEERIDLRAPVDQGLARSEGPGGRVGGERLYRRAAGVSQSFGAQRI